MKLVTKANDLYFTGTHGFSFKPQKPGVADFALSRHYLNNPENSFYGLMPFVIAGLHERDFPRIQIREFSDVVKGTLYMAVDESAEYNDSDPCPKEINDDAFTVARKFLDEVYEAGFSASPIRIEEGDPCALDGDTISAIFKEVIKK